ncbi:MAG: flagellar basal-body protein FlbY [Hyphomonadaceae bacterium]
MNAIDVEERGEQLEAMTRRLIGLVTAEAAAVQAHRLSAANADWDEKERLVHAWRIEVSRIKADPTLLSGLSQMRKDQLRVSSRELETALEAHAMALAASKSVTEGLVRSIASEIASARAAPAGYGRSGVSAAANRQASGLAVNAKA